MSSLDSILTDSLDVAPECKIIKFLEWITNILNGEQMLDIDKLCSQLEQMNFNEGEIVSSNSSQDTVIVESNHIKDIIFSESGVKENLEKCVHVMLAFIKNEIENFDGTHFTHYKKIIMYTTSVCKFLQVCEKNDIATNLIKNYVTKFLADLFSILATADGVNFLEKAPIYQPTVKVIGFFKETEYAKSIILKEIDQGLISFDNIKKNTVNKFDMYSYEILLLYLTVLKDILEYNLSKLLVKSIKINEEDEKVLLNIHQNLTKTVGNVPEYVQILIQECLNLIS